MFEHSRVEATRLLGGSATRRLGDSATRFCAQLLGELSGFLSGPIIGEKPEGKRGIVPRDSEQLEHVSEAKGKALSIGKMPAAGVSSWHEAFDDAAVARGEDTPRRRRRRISVRASGSHRDAIELARRILRDGITNRD
jgi:hypothetical protein